MWRRVRIGILLLVLFVVAGGTWSDRQRTTDWRSTLWVGMFPVKRTTGPTTGPVHRCLEQEQFAGHRGVPLPGGRGVWRGLDQPVKVVLYPQVAGRLPPRLDPGTGFAGRIWWSLRLRYYTWRQAGDTPADIRVFVLYHDPERTNDRAPLSRPAGGTLRRGPCLRRRAHVGAQ